LRRKNRELVNSQLKTSCAAQNLVEVFKTGGSTLSLKQGYGSWSRAFMLRIQHWFHGSLQPRRSSSHSQAVQRSWCLNALATNPLAPFSMQSLIAAEVASRLHLPAAEVCDGPATSYAQLTTLLVASGTLQHGHSPGCLPLMYSHRFFIGGTGAAKKHPRGTAENRVLRSKQRQEPHKPRKCSFDQKRSKYTCSTLYNDSENSQNCEVISGCIHYIEENLIHQQKNPKCRFTGKNTTTQPHPAQQNCVVVPLQRNATKSDCEYSRMQALTLHAAICIS